MGSHSLLKPRMSSTCPLLPCSILLVFALSSHGSHAMPRHGHLSFLPASKGMRVMWNDPEHWPNSNVRWGFAANNLTHSSLASSHTYAIDDMCGAPANDPKSWVDPGWMYDAEMNIAPGSLSQIVFYDFGNATHRSLVHSFTWGPKSQSSTSFIAYGDMGTGSDRDKNSTAEILSHLEGVDVVVHVGDISYAMGHGSKWDEWFHEIEPVSTQVPYHVVLGNHEFDWPGQSFKPLAFLLHEGQWWRVWYPARQKIPYAWAKIQDPR